MPTTTEQTCSLQTQPASRARKLYITGLYLYALTCHFSISASQISLGLSLIGFIIELYNGRTTIKSTPIDKPFATFVFFAVLSLFRAEQFADAFFNLKSLLVIFVLYLAYWSKIDEKQKNRITECFVFSAGLTSLVSLAGDLFVLHVERRAQGFFSMSMTFGECQALAMLCGLFLLSRAKEKSFTSRLLLLTAFTASGFSLVFSMVRGAWLGFAVGSFMLATRYPRQVITLVLLAMLAIAPVAYEQPEIRDRISGINPFVSQATSQQVAASSALQSSLIRLKIWQRGLTMLQNNFQFGVGLENVKMHYEKLMSEQERSEETVWGHQHSNFMHVLVTSGMTGLIAFFYFIISAGIFFLNPINSNNHDKNNLSIETVAIFLSFLVFGFSEFAWGDQEVCMMAMFLCGLFTCQSKACADAGNAVSDTGIPAANASMFSRVV